MQSPNTTPRKIKWQKNGESTDEATKKKKAKSELGEAFQAFNSLEN
jgi:hypothetical protein